MFTAVIEHITKDGRLTMGQVSDAVAEYLRTADLLRTRRHIVAEHLGMHTSLFGNRLRDEGTSYLALLNAERKRRLQECGHRKVEQLVSILGFWHPDSVRRWLK